MIKSQKSINVQAGIRACRGENFPKINKRTCTFIQYSRVIPRKLVKFPYSRFLLLFFSSKLAVLMGSIWGPIFETPAYDLIKSKSKILTNADLNDTSQIHLY